MPRKIVIWSSQNKIGFSGGRYHACILAKALALAGYEVYFATNHTPVFFHEVIDSSCSSLVKIVHCIKENQKVVFDKIPKDCVFSFIVPGGRVNFRAITQFSKKINSKVILLNFESGNWFNKYSPVKRPLELWSSWEEIAENASLILSSNHESSVFAKEFYQVDSNTVFDYAYPALNGFDFNRLPKKNREKRLTIFLSVAPDVAHKGGEHLHFLLDEALAGYTLTLISGKGQFPPYFTHQLELKAKNYRIHLDWRKQITDCEKYSLLSQTEIMLFPSFFEGYGYPPIEGLCCGAQVLCFDLPVLRETCGESLHYAKHGDWRDFKEKLILLVRGEISKKPSSEKVFKIAKIETMSDKLHSILQKLSPERQQQKRNRAAASSLLLYPPFRSKKERDEVLSHLKFFLPYLFFPKSPYKIKIDLEEKNKWLSWVQPSKSFERLMSSAYILCWKNVLNEAESKEIQGFSHKMILLNERNDLTKLESFRLGLFEKAIRKPKRQEMLRNNKAKLSKFHAYLYGKGATKAVFWEPNETSYVEGSFIQENEVAVSDETILKDELALASFKPDVILMKDFTKIVLEKKSLEEVLKNALNFFLLKPRGVILAEEVDGYPLVEFFPEFQDRLILIPESPHTTAWNLHQSFLIPKREKGVEGFVDASLFTLFESVKKIETVA